MRKLYFTITFVVLANMIYSQSANFNLKKYWYLKWRLTNYFMVTGPNYGEGMPFGIRNWQENTITAGDAPNYLATYIGVLATELKLLKQNGLDYNETKRQLYYALWALNRLDDCENRCLWGVFDEGTCSNQYYLSNLINNCIPKWVTSG